MVGRGARSGLRLPRPTPSVQGHCRKKLAPQFLKRVRSKCLKFIKIFPITSDKKPQPCRGREGGPLALGFPSPPTKAKNTPMVPRMAWCAAGHCQSARASLCMEGLAAACGAVVVQSLVSQRKVLEFFCGYESQFRVMKVGRL